MEYLETSHILDHSILEEILKYGTHPLSKMWLNVMSNFQKSRS